MVQLSDPYMTAGKTIDLTTWIFVSKGISLLFNTLSRFVIAFLPRSQCLLILWLQSLSTMILEHKKIKISYSFTLLPFLSTMKWWDWRPWSWFWMLILFKPAFSLSSFIFIKRLFSFTSLSAIRVVSSVYLRLLIFLPAILVPACNSSSLAFHMMYSAYVKVPQSCLTLCDPMEFSRPEYWSG